MTEVRCASCGRLLAKGSDCQTLEIKCPRCGAYNTIRATSPTPERRGAPKGASDDQTAVVRVVGR